MFTGPPVVPSKPRQGTASIRQGRTWAISWLSSGLSPAFSEIAGSLEASTINTMSGTTSQGDSHREVVTFPP